MALLLFGGVAIYVWDGQNRQDLSVLLRHTRSSAAQVRIRLEGLMGARMASLGILAERWVERVPPDFRAERFSSFAQEYVTHFVGFAAINWVDPEGVVQWVYPHAAGPSARGHSVYDRPEPSYAETFERARRTLTPQTTPCVELVQGGIGFETFSPLIFDGKIQGYLNAVFRLDRLLHLALPKGMLVDFDVDLREGDRVVYADGDHEQLDPTEAQTAVETIIFPGKSLLLVLRPKSRVPEAVRRRNLPLLASGLIAAGTLALLLYLLLQRMEMFRRAHEQALEELAERRRAEEALRENEKKLETALAELSAKNVELETFVYTVSHDLKTPVVTLEGFIGALREDFGDRLPEEGHRYLGFMSEASQRMNALISDLLELSRIGRTAETMQEIALSTLLGEVLALLESRIKGRGVEVRLRGDAVLTGQRRRLAQVLENLVANSVKYIGHDNPRPLVEVGAKRIDGEVVCFVQDNGIGIEPQHFDRIFEVFQRLPAARNQEGTGVGLCIVKRIIETHGGHLWLESQPGEGTTFYFTLGTGKEVGGDGV